MDEVRYLRKRSAGHAPGGGHRRARIASATGAARRSHHLPVPAERLAERWPGTADPETVETNMVRVDVAAPPGDIGAIRQRLAEDGILTERRRRGGGGWSLTGTSTGRTSIGWWRHRGLSREGPAGRRLARTGGPRARPRTSPGGLSRSHPAPLGPQVVVGARPQVVDLGGPPRRWSIRWSRWQRWAGTGQVGNEQVRSGASTWRR